jgi:chorismate synthase
VAFKPTSSIGQTQETINQAGESIQLNLEGRHDPCVVIRAVPIIEAIAYFTLYNSYLENKIETR